MSDPPPPLLPRLAGLRRRLPLGTHGWRAWMAVTMAAFLLGTAFYELPWRQRLEGVALDLQYRLHRDGQWRDPRILIVAVDQQSLDYFEQDNIPFPWPRSLYNPIVEYARANGAKAVVFDVLFNNPLGFGPADDAEFAAAMKRVGEVYLAAAVTQAEQRQPDDPATVDRPEPSPPPGIESHGVAPAAVRRNGISLPGEPIRSAAAGFGSVSQGPDPDGVYRRVRPLVDLNGRVVPLLGLTPVVGPASAPTWSADGVTLNGRSLALDELGQATLRFRGGDAQFEQLSAKEVILAAGGADTGGTVTPDLFHDRYIFVAYTAPGIHDLKPTPVSPLTPGVFVHATLLANYLDNDFLRPIPVAWGFGFALLLSALVTAVLLGIQRAWLSAGVASGVVAGALALTQYDFVQGRLWSLPLLLLVALSAFILTPVYRYQTEGKQRRFLQMALGHYVSPQVVERIIDSRQRLELGGERREITVMFADLQGFTTLSEQLDPQTLVGLLNDYTSIMADVILGRHGTVDKFIGDAVMAFWGAPLDQPEQSRLAIEAALECQSQFTRFFASRYPEVPMAVRIGIDRGECIVGNMGSRRRFDYTAIGDTVNQASRLEGLNKAYGSRMLVGEHAWTPVRTLFLGRRVDYLKVKGKSHGVVVYEPLGSVAEASTAAERLCLEYETAFAAYQQRRWDEAEQRLRALLETQDDPPSRALLARIQRFRAEPPAADWDGAYAHTSK